jgi:serine/threonine protein kinase
MIGTVFHRVGRYEIHEEIGRGGMAVVFLATDTLTNQRVALKLVSVEADRDGQQVLEAERWGATLQEEFSRESRFVPAVYEHGTQGQYFFIAMEHLGGRNLSEVISSGPLPPERAVHIATQLCEFLQAAEAFERTLDGRKFSRLLHGDLKPRNIRVLDDDEIKVFDFGIAKALSLSRKVTRNDFGSIAYLSPERLESGDIDAQAEFWAVGVLLYEMVSGVQPFRAADTRRLEHRIRAREAPPPLNGACPPALKAIIAKLLAPAATDRYGTASAIREDLQRFTSGEPVAAAREGWSGPTHDDQATRRTRPPLANDNDARFGGASPPLANDNHASSGGAGSSSSQSGNAEEITRRTIREAPAGVPIPVAPPRKRRLRWLARNVLIAIVILMALNEIRVYIIAGALAENVPQEIGGVIRLWNQYRELNAANLGAQRLERALTRQTSSLAAATFQRYRTAAATVYEKEWLQTRDALAFAVGASPADRELQAALRYCDGHLRRINGEARIRSNLVPAAQQELSAAVAAFRQAAELRPDWPDPFLGLMRAFIALDDVELGADALAQAERYGHTAGDRDWALLGEGYLRRATKLAEVEELEPLTRAADAYSKAVEHFSKAVAFGTTAQRLREARRRLRDVQERIDRLSLVTADWHAA